MENNHDVVKRDTRDVFGYKVGTSSWPRLKELSRAVVYPNSQAFSKQYEDLLPLLDVQVEDRALHTLLQFYDSELRCFTFQDYQLALTLEEYSYISRIKITDDIPFSYVPNEPDYDSITKALYLSLSDVKGNWRKKGTTSGLSEDFLICKAREMATKHQWVEFNSLLVILIYGLVI